MPQIQVLMAKDQKKDESSNELERDKLFSNYHQNYCQRYDLGSWSHRSLQVLGVQDKKEGNSSFEGGNVSRMMIESYNSVNYMSEKNYEDLLN